MILTAALIAVAFIWRDTPQPRYAWWLKWERMRRTK